MRLRRDCLTFLLAVSAVLSSFPFGGSAFAQSAPAAFTPSPWLDDFHQLLREMSSHYANLDWALEQRRMDLPNLRGETDAALAQAKNEAEARHALEHFLASFGDGHLEVDWPSGEAQVAPTSDNHAPLCDRLGYKQRGKMSVDFSLLPQFSEFAGESAERFPGGLLRLPSGKIVGVVRIGIFSEKGYPEACAQALRMLQLAGDAMCNDECADRVSLQAADVLTAALAARVEKLRRAGASVLLVDITRNGGGSDWVGAVARALSAKPLHDPRLAFIRHPHWTIELEEELKSVHADLEAHRGPEPALRDAASTLERSIAASRQGCPRDDVWTTGKVGCSLLVNDLRYASGVLSYAAPGSFAGLNSQTALFQPAQYAYTENADRLPLYVLVDGDTWSAAEYFAAVLQDNKAATIVGQLTGGAGCGYTNGGIEATLTHSKAAVRMPDCVRLRADGSNEVSGVTPDKLIAWSRRDSPYQRAQKLLFALQSLP